MLKDEGRILSHGVSEGLQDFPKMECMGWDGMGWDIGYDVATATLFNGSPPSLLSPLEGLAVGRVIPKKNLPHNHPSCCSQTTTGLSTTEV